ncbi:MULTISPECIES: cation diffusion facilitator family transporter [unclassified Methanoregula]|uniref:cation diffusion facilitator family transporter n=1 Tax=unclassified Methanoregula TaxID=2649730 RepID=UPI0009CF5CB1|nr:MULTISPECIES: cation transporter [unclassified Methanoregula]OPX64562.1 MAG: Cation efflux family protein [Methanoregula sp. PtaB.Bin085]OPY33315.1 MAG: Cation efflux family protein [Methanoregula sp. PtaU1.Bin006]
MDSGSGNLWRTALRLEYFTIAYNIAEAALSIFFGMLAGSIALVGFGLDSIVESLSAIILVWRLRRHGTVSREDEEKIERTAQRFVAVTFFVLGVYVLYESSEKLLGHEAVQPSAAGILIAIASIIIMPVLAWKKQSVGNAIGSKALVADSKETIACAFLSVALLLGLGANYLFGFWQADPIAGFVIVLFLFREGYEGWAEAGEDGDDPDSDEEPAGKNSS